VHTDTTNLKEWSTRILNVLPSKGKYDVKPSAPAEAPLPAETAAAKVVAPSTQAKKSSVVDDVLVEPLKKNCIVH